MRRCSHAFVLLSQSALSGISGLGFLAFFRTLSIAFLHRGGTDRIFQPSTQFSSFACVCARECVYHAMCQKGLVFRFVVELCQLAYLSLDLV
ncbi:hypothetical protein F5Y10DRAFT_242479 [Nemania abortiva]|nr:hypothetical protein F5Y10DRAFT_242479 [Nemania abortiva]